MESHAVSFTVRSLSLTVPELAWIPAFPLAAFFLLITLGRRLGRHSPWVAVSTLLVSWLLTLSTGPAIFGGDRLIVRWPWLSATDPRWSIGLAADGLSWVMLLIVTTIGTLIAVYSIGYMHEDARLSRFFAYFSLFCASMLGLVLADGFLLLYVCWELVGLCSYLLISFWFEKPVAAAAGRKAFITTRIGDTGLLLGILLLAWAGGPLRFDRLVELHGQLPVALLTVISTLVFLGAAGKSAQIPLHVWLPDAMEGPTPVSALIHAATMVAAGVYLVARTFSLFTAESLQIVLGIGLATHLLAGTVALTQTDIKRVLAYSTLSQLGFMFVALGLGAVSAGMFHLYTHAFFKALLFLAAGSVIHATHQQDLAHLGGLRRAMPITSAVFLIAACSMGGLPLFSGFWSKDAVLLAARERAPIVMWLLVAGAVMTASYIFRLYLRCFHGAPAPSAHLAGGPSVHEHGKRHESPLIMTGPMVCLAFGAMCAGFAGSPAVHGLFYRLVGDAHAHVGIDVPVLLLSVAILVVGIALAWVVGVQRRNLLPVVLRPLGYRLYLLAAHKYYVDETYERFLIRPLLGLAQRLARWDQVVIDGAVDAVGAFGDRLSVWKARFDQLVVDGLVNGVADVLRRFGMILRQLQTGFIQHYLLVVVIAAAVLSALARR